MVQHDATDAQHRYPVLPPSAGNCRGNRTVDRVRARLASRARRSVVCERKNASNADPVTAFRSCFSSWPHGPTRAATTHDLTGRAADVWAVDQISAPPSVQARQRRRSQTSLNFRGARGRGGRRSDGFAGTLHLLRPLAHWITHCERRRDVDEAHIAVSKPTFQPLQRALICEQALRLQRGAPRRPSRPAAEGWRARPPARTAALRGRRNGVPGRGRRPAPRQDRGRRSPATFFL